MSHLVFFVTYRETREFPKVAAAFCLFINFEEHDT